jgi:hypothetical protein
MRAGQAARRGLLSVTRFPICKGRTMAAEQASDWGKKWGQIVARAWADEAFKRRLLASPAAVLKEHGLGVRPGVQLRVLADTDQVVHLTVPQRPGSAALAEEELDRVAGGVVKSDSYVHF